VVLIAIAVVSRNIGSVFTAGLTIASLVYGPLLGAFLLGILTKRANQTGVMAGMSSSLLLMGLIWAAANVPAVHQLLPISIAWTWYVLIGTVICLSVGYAVSRLAPTTRSIQAEVTVK